jgi:hypothetical protein
LIWLHNLPPAPSSGETVISAPDPSCHKRARRDEVGSDSGRTEDDRHSPRLEPVASETRAEEPVRLEVPADTVSSPVAAPEVDSTPAGEITLAGAAAPLPPATEDVAMRNNAAACAPSDPPSQEGTREVAMEATEETPVRAGLLEPPEPAARTPSSPRLMLNVQATVPIAGTGAGATAGSLLFRMASSSGEASQGLLATRVTRNERDNNSPAPEVATKGALSGKAPATAAGAGVGSLSSASQLQQEWADTSSSADAREKLKVQGSKPNLAELDK